MITEIRVYHSRQTLRFVAVLSGVMLAFTFIDAEAVTLVFGIAATVFAIALTRGLLTGDIRDQRWALLFQLPGHPIVHYTRVLGVTLLTGLIPLMAVAATAVALANAAEPRAAIGMAAGGILFFILLVIAAFGISTLVRQAETELTLLYLGLSIGQDLLYEALNLAADFRHAVSVLLFPVNAIGMYARHWAGFDVEIAAHYLPQLILYPAAWLAISAYRLNVLNRGD